MQTTTKDDTESQNLGRGRRRMTPGLRRAGQLAKSVEQDPLPPRHQITNAVHLLRSVNRISSEDAETLHVLIGFCGMWESHGIPTVFATNRRIRSRMGGVRSDRALRYRLASLGRLGLVHHDEQSGARRRFEIDAETGEHACYGISLLPLVALLPETQRIEAEREATYKATTTMRRQAGALTSLIIKLAAAAIDLGYDRAEWRARVAFAEDAYALARSCDDLDDLESYLDQIRDAYNDCERIVDTAMASHTRVAAAAVDELSTENGDKPRHESQVISSHGDTSLPPYTINKPITDKSVHCTQSDERKRAKRPAIPGGDPGKPGCFGLEAKPCGSAGPVKTKDHNQRQRLATDTPAGSDIASAEQVSTEIDRHFIEPKHLIEISEGLAAYLPLDADEAAPSWPEVIVAAERLRSVIGMSEYGWRTVIKRIGLTGAVAAMAYATADRTYSRVASAPGYIRRLADLASEGATLDIGAKIRKVMRLMA